MKTSFVLKILLTALNCFHSLFNKYTSFRIQDIAIIRTRNLNLYKFLVVVVNVNYKRPSYSSRVLVDIRSLLKRIPVKRFLLLCLWWSLGMFFSQVEHQKKNIRVQHQSATCFTTNCWWIRLSDCSTLLKFMFTSQLLKNG